VVFGMHMSPVATLVERNTRFLMLVALPRGDHKADAVADALAAAISTLPQHLAKSLTWDPRQTLGFKTPSQGTRRGVALTA
jgi:IS30 family transposase